MGRFRRAVRDGRDRGVSAIELAFVAPAILMFIFFGIQAGLWWYGRTVALQAAREGVSSLRLAPDKATFDQMQPAVVSAVQGYAHQLGRETLLQPQVTALWQDPGGQAVPQVNVQVTGHVVSLIPGMDLSVKQQAFGQVELFQSDTVAP